MRRIFLAQFIGYSPQQQFVFDQCSHLCQRLPLRSAELPRPMIHHAKRAKGVTFRSAQRSTRIKANGWFAGHKRVIYEARVERGIWDDQPFVDQHRLGAKRQVARSFLPIKSADRFKPLTLGIHQSHGNNRRVVQTGNHGGNVLEPCLRRGIQHTVGAQRCQTSNLINLWKRNHDRNQKSTQLLLCMFAASLYVARISFTDWGLFPIFLPMLLTGPTCFPRGSPHCLLSVSTSVTAVNRDTCKDYTLTLTIFMYA